MEGGKLEIQARSPKWVCKRDNPEKRLSYPFAFRLTGLSSLTENIRRSPKEEAVWQEVNLRSEVEPQLRGVRPWRNKMGPTEGRKKVIERRLVCQVNNVGLQAPLVSVAVEEI